MRGARTFSGLLLSLWVASAAVAASSGGAAPAGTYRLFTISVVRDAPGGRIDDIWSGGTLFTARPESGHWLRISGRFPHGRWQPLRHPLWVLDDYARPRAARRMRSRHHPGIDRFIVIDKRRFLLKVVDRTAAGSRVIYKTRVALGLDGCKPRDKGGRCYYTRPGIYHVRWKVHDPHGIKWCIPDSMDREYRSDLLAGKRCFRGPLGRYALNIGNSYAIHETDRPDLLGHRVSHGCVRLANSAIRVVYGLMDVGDTVKIVR